MAATLQSRGNGVVSGRSAAALWGIWSANGEAIEVTLVGAAIGRTSNIVSRRRAALPAGAVAFLRAVPLTSPAMTLVDLAAVLRPLELEAALANALRLRLVRLAKLRQFVTATPTSTPGRAQLSDLLEQRQPIRDTRSIYERKLLELIAAAELPQPLTNATVAGHMVDLFWPQERLVVEFDGWAYHNGRGAFETDRRRDQDLLGIGVRVARVTARQIDDTPYAAVARLARALRCD